MKTVNDSVNFAMSAKDSAVFAHSFSVSCTGFWDAEYRGCGSYSFLETNGRCVDDSVCIGLSCQQIFVADLIRVGSGVCALYRFIEEKVSGFTAVVRQSWRQFRRRTGFRYRREKKFFRRQVPERPQVLSCAGGLRL